MKPVPVDVSLELNSRQLSASLNSLQKIRNKLHTSELVLNDEPPADEVRAMIEWKKKVHDLFVKEKLDFPTLGVIKGEFDEKSKVQAEIEESKAVMIKKYELPPHTMEALKKSRENKRFGPFNYMFGPKQDGEVITEIKDYKGANSIHRNVRPVIRRDYKGSALTPLSGLPPWMGPNYYDNTDPKVMKKSSSVNFTLGRTNESKKSASELRHINIMHRHDSVISRDERRHQHSYAQENVCHRPDHQFTTPIEDVIPLSRSSARSTMLMENPLSSATSPPLGPRRVRLGARSMNPTFVGDGHGGTIRFEPDDITVQSDTLQAKVSRLGEKTYRVNDYTLDGLALQAKNTRTYLTESFVPDEEDDLYSSLSHGSFNNKHKGILTSANDLLSNDSPDDGNDNHSISAFSFTNSSDFSSISTDIYRISGVDQAIAELVEVHNITAQELADSSLRVKREKLEKQVHSELVSDNAVNDKTANDFVSYTLQYRSQQRSRMRSRQQRSRSGAGNEKNSYHILNTTIPPLSDNIRPRLRSYFEEHNIYAPIKPQNTKYLKAHHTSPPVVVHGLLLPENDNLHSKPEIDAMISELDFPPNYFTLPLDALREDQKNVTEENRDDVYRVPTSHPSHSVPSSIAKIKVVRRCEPRVLTAQPIFVKSSSTPTFDSIVGFPSGEGSMTGSKKGLGRVIDYSLAASNEIKGPILAADLENQQVDGKQEGQDDAVAIAHEAES